MIQQKPPLLPPSILDAFQSQVGFDFALHAFLVCRSGSATHGTKLSTSDDDFFAVVVPPAERLIGLEGFDGWEPTGLGIDVRVYSLRKYIGLLLKNNPNVLETLWLRQADYCPVHTSWEFYKLILLRDHFSSLHAYHAFTGYAYDQLQRLETSRYSRNMGEKRKLLVDQFGYDPKNAAHLIRLFRSGIEFVQTGQLTVYRPDRAELMDIKQGKWSLAQVKTEGERLAAVMKTTKEGSPLSAEPDRESAQQYLINVTELRSFPSNVPPILMSLSQGPGL